MKNSHWVIGIVVLVVASLAMSEHFSLGVNGRGDTDSSQRPTTAQDEPISETATTSPSRSAKYANKSSYASSSPPEPTRSEESLQRCLVEVRMQLKIWGVKSQFVGRKNAAQKIMDEVRKSQGDWCLEYAFDQGIFR